MTDDEAAEKASAEMPIARQLAAAERELGMRRSVYLRRVEAGKMTPEQMARGTWEMLAIIGTLRRLAGPRPTQGTLL